MRRWLALDFDGVISDSAPEAFLVALRTFVRLRPGSPLGAAHAEIDVADAERAGAPSRARIQDHPLYRDFLDMMPLGNRAEDYAVELVLLEKGERVESQESYDARRAEVDAGFLHAFHRRFYEERESLSRGDPDGWRALLGPYPAFTALLRRRAGDAELAIATSKDRRSVGLLLRDYGLADLFPESRILDKETGVSKEAHLRRLHTDAGAPFEAITFVDDKVNHLDSVAGLGVRCALAAWGYNGERERRLAGRRGYGVCTLEDAERQLFDA